MGKRKQKQEKLNIVSAIMGFVMFYFMIMGLTYFIDNVWVSTIIMILIVMINIKYSRG